MTTFFLIRHATNDFVGWSLAGRRPGVRLNAEGREQAVRLAGALAGETLAGVYCSPLERAVETARPLCDRHGLEPTLADDLLEIDYGDWTGSAVADLAEDPHWRRFNSFRSGTRAPNGEMMIEVQARIAGLLHRLADARPGKSLALVSHGDLIRAALLHYLGAPIDHVNRIEISPASISVVRVGPDGPLVLAMNRTV
jgi:broad specificity phosphatase PhoE